MSVENFSGQSKTPKQEETDRKVPFIPSLENEFAILGLPKQDTTESVVKKAFRSQARLHHPDANKKVLKPGEKVENVAGDDSTFKQINAAYEKIKRYLDNPKDSEFNSAWSGRVYSAGASAKEGVNFVDVFTEFQKIRQEKELLQSILKYFPKYRTSMYQAVIMPESLYALDYDTYYTDEEKALIKRLMNDSVARATFLQEKEKERQRNIAARAAELEHQKQSRALYGELDDRITKSKNEINKRINLISSNIVFLKELDNVLINLPDEFKLPKMTIRGLDLKDVYDYYNSALAKLDSNNIDPTDIELFNNDLAGFETRLDHVLLLKENAIAERTKAIIDIYRKCLAELNQLNYRYQDYYNLPDSDAEINKYTLLKLPEIYSFLKSARQKDESKKLEEAKAKERREQWEQSQREYEARQETAIEEKKPEINLQDIERMRKEAQKPVELMKKPERVTYLTKIQNGLGKVDSFEPTGSDFLGELVASLNIGIDELTTNSSAENLLVRQFAEKAYDAYMRWQEQRLKQPVIDDFENYRRLLEYQWCEQNKESNLHSIESSLVGFEYSDHNRYKTSPLRNLDTVEQNIIFDQQQARKARLNRSIGGKARLVVENLAGGIANVVPFMRKSEPTVKIPENIRRS